MRGGMVGGAVEGKNVWCISPLHKVLEQTAVVASSEGTGHYRQC